MKPDKLLCDGRCHSPLHRDAYVAHLHALQVLMSHKCPLNRSKGKGQVSVGSLLLCCGYHRWSRELDWQLKDDGSSGQRWLFNGQQVRVSITQREAYDRHVEEAVDEDYIENIS